MEIRPQPKQELFLSSPADIAIYGGAAGGGKTWSLLIEPLRHIRNSDFGAVCFRRTIPEVTAESGLWDEACKLYSMLGAKLNNNEHQCTFPSGMRVTFSHMQHENDCYSWKSSQIPLILWDQLETFTSQQFFYMFSRNRSLCGVKPYMRATANPEPGWLAEFLDWWIAEDGYADLSRSGNVRWMVRNGDQLKWADTREELIAQYPELFPKSVTFILSTIYDNQVLLQNDPNYLANLQAMSLVDRERLMGDKERGGNWKIKPSAGKVFNKAWFDVADALPAGGVVVRRWDFAATEKELNKPDPDYTASCLMLMVRGEYFILDVTAEQIAPAEVERRFLNITRQDAVRFRAEGRRYMSRWEVEPGSAGKREGVRLTRMLAGVDARGRSSSGDKLTRAKPLAAQAEAGNVRLVQGGWNQIFLEHMHGQPELPHDDIMDASSGAFLDLVHLPAGEAKSYQG